MGQEEKISMEIVNPHAAGIDIGSRSHWVGIGQHEKDVREFGVFNQDLFEKADWLHQNKIRTIAMESTGTLLAKSLCRAHFKRLSCDPLQW